MTRPKKQDHDRGEPRPDTALGEALKEFEEAETRNVGKPEPDKDPHGGSGGGDALTPNEGAQEEAGHG
ncbi:hypothetical protein [Streptomyces sp. NBC_01431]|uniref:hypothetical protein n=1 Tax=Streptomyces sp. NBC_01431 TaxID=2903863 RepID=UPI002E351613|nr:hypothetical protein [Streptomyces sp. NBC_01431]